MHTIPQVPHNTIQAAREAKGLSRAALAKAMGINDTTLWRWETFRMAIAHPTLIKLAKLLDSTPVALVPELTGELLTEEEPTHV